MLSYLGPELTDSIFQVGHFAMFWLGVNVHVLGRMQDLTLLKSASEAMEEE